MFVIGTVTAEERKRLETMPDVDIVRIVKANEFNRLATGSNSGGCKEDQHEEMAILYVDRNIMDFADNG
jgi:hypothetical protein